MTRRRFWPPAIRTHGISTPVESGDESLFASCQSSSWPIPVLSACSPSESADMTPQHQNPLPPSTSNMINDKVSTKHAAKEIENATPPRPGSEFPLLDLKVRREQFVISPGRRQVTKSNVRNAEVRPPTYNARKALGIVTQGRKRQNVKRPKLKDDDNIIRHFSEKRTPGCPKTVLARKDVFHFVSSPKKNNSQSSQSSSKDLGISKFKKTVLKAIMKAHEEFCELKKRRHKLREKQLTQREIMSNEQQVMPSDVPCNRFIDLKHDSIASICKDQNDLHLWCFGDAPQI